MERLVVATRKSALALAQCRALVKELLAAHPDLAVEELLVVTTGDRIVDRPLSEVGGKGLFIKEIEEAILDGRAHFAVHSLKDVPPVLASGLLLGSVPRRADPRDVVVTRSGCMFAQLPSGAKVGTSSLRRKAQLQAQRPDLSFVPLRGNVDTRLRKCREGEIDAIVLARAGLVRLGLEAEITETLDAELCLPAVGQGALAIELSSEDERTLARVLALNDPETSVAVAAERGVMRAVEGDCQTPVAAYAQREGDVLFLRAMLAEPDGSRLRRRAVRVVWPRTEAEAAEVGVELGRALKSA